jgi:peptidoglycan/LPS O-acetylase OafA/YrhL
VRFCAALLVFLSHLPLLPGMEGLAKWRLFDSGVAGVSFFFVLSGFILTYNYAEVFADATGRADYQRFVWNRLTKIYPVHLVITMAMIPAQIFSPNLPLDYRAVPFHLALAQCWWPSAYPTFMSYLNVPSWSISCEWFFYLLAPLAIYCAFNRKVRYVPGAVLVVYAIALTWAVIGKAAYTELHMVSWFAPSRVPEFLCGVYLAEFYLAERRERSARSASTLQLAGVFLVALGAIYRPHAPWPLWGGLLYLPGAMLLVYGLAQGKGILRAALAGKLVHRLGVASFSFYLFHAPFLRCLRIVWLRLGWHVGSWVEALGAGLLIFGVTQSCALVICYRFEVPVQKRLRKWFEPKSKAPDGRQAAREESPLRARAAGAA